MEKTWQTDPNFIVATTGSYLVMTQSVMMELKNHMVDEAGWTVVGSSNGAANYEFDGITGGGSYGGESTGPYDVWAALADIPRQLNSNGPGWCVLKSPVGRHGPFYALRALEGSTDTGSNSYTWYSDQNWVPHAAPLLNMPTRAEGAAVHGRSRYTFNLMFSGTFTTRGYFSGAPEDGSFIFATNLTSNPNFTGLQMFHVTDPAHPATVMPTCSYSASFSGATTRSVNADRFYTYHPRYDSVFTGEVVIAVFAESGMRSVATFPQYDSTRVFSVMTTTNYATEVDAFPLFLTAEDDTSAEELGRSTFVSRIPDVYSAPEGLTEADVMPPGSAEHFVFGDWLLPGDTIPLLGP